MNLYELERDAVAELRDWREEHPREEPHDAIFEIADGAVPVYTHQLLRLAADNITLATAEPELGPASGCNFDGTPSPVNIIAANVFEHIEQALWNAWSDMQDEDEEEVFMSEREQRLLKLLSRLITALVLMHLSIERGNAHSLKDRPTYGKLAFYVRGQHELLLIGVKGSCLPKAGTLPVSVLTAAKGRHSEKPEDAYTLIEQMFDGPYLELFARQTREGWTVFGNEVRERDVPYGDVEPALSGQAVRVLLVEDDPDLRGLFSLVLSVAGCQVTAVEDIATGGQVAITGVFDVLVTDYALPDGTGAELIETLQRVGSPIATILMSSHAHVDTHAAACHADGWFWKGHDLSRLVALVSTLGAPERPSDGEGG